MERTKNYIYQYKVLFYLSWIGLYLIFPAWISSHSIVQANGFSRLSDPFARTLAILGLIIYFSISAYLINRYFNALTVDKPVIMKINDWFGNIKGNLWLVIVCCLSVVLHIHSLSLIELGYIEHSLWMYDFSNKYWHRIFDFPIQYGFWSLIVLLILIIKQKTTFKSISDYINATFSNNFVKFISIFIMFVFFSLYSYFYPYSSEESINLLRYPPAAKLLYLINYYGFGVSPMGPRIIQLIFYVLSAVYLYRTINLFRKKETALLGATIYLFSPIIFHYASITFYETGIVFFIILISFHFLKFLKDQDSRDLILTSFFIGIGFMYKQVILAIFIICFAYLILSRMKKRDWHSFIDFKILLLSLIFVLPFMMIGKSMGLNFYYPVWSRLISFDGLKVYSLMIESQLSLIIFVLFLISYIFILLIKRDHLSLYYGFFFIAYYVFITIPKNSELNHRYATALYPAIAVLLAQFIFSITQRIRWKHSFKLASLILTVYLIFLCLVPRSRTNLITFKYKDFEIQQYPIEQVTDWIRDRTNNNDKILFLSIPWSYKFYIEKIYADKDKINPERFIYVKPIVKDLIYPLQNLKEFCYAENISYIVFPFGPKNSYPDVGASEDAKYLEGASNDDLIEVARFNLEDNYIIIDKLKDKSSVIIR